MLNRDQHPTTSNLLLIVSRLPEPGITKTRLAAAVGDKIAAALHLAFLLDLTAKFTPLQAAQDGYRLGWGFSPPEADFGSFLQSIAPDIDLSHIDLVPQSGAGFTDRLANLADWGHTHGYRNTIVMATDSPHLAVDQIPLAFTLMETHGVVLGRVLDGGYYLACVRGNGDVIRQSKTGSDDAAQSLAQVAVKMGLSVGELKRTFDVDTWDDLVLLADHLAQFPGDAPNTLAALKKHSLDDPSARLEMVEKLAKSFQNDQR